MVRGVLACLAEAGLLARSGEQPVLQEPSPIHGELVSAVVVSYNSRGWLEGCLEALAVQSYTPLEVIVVDNGSTDGSTQWLKHGERANKVLLLEATLGLASAINRGVEQAHGAYILLLNPDTRLEPGAIAQMVAVAQGDPRCAAVAPKLKFMWAPGFINGLGNRVGASGWGTDNALGHLDLGQFDGWEAVPSACFAAALVSRAAWEAVGPLDEGYPLYYEDVDWCYRARLMGYVVRAAPKAVVYHALGRRVHTGQEIDLTPHKLRCVVYGRQRFALKILALPRWLRFSILYTLEDLGRTALALFKPDWSAIRAVAGGWWKLVRDFSTILIERRRAQARRKLTDGELLALPVAIPPPHIWRGLPELTWDLVEHHYLPLIRSGKTRSMPEFDTVQTHRSARPRLLIVSNDLVDVKMAGPGLRYLEMCRALSTDLDVTLAVPGATMLVETGFELVPYEDAQPGPLRQRVERSDVVLASPFILGKFPWLEVAAARLVLDLYDPFIFENLHYYLAEPMDVQEQLNLQSVELLNRAARAGDFFVCGSERQRDLWMGLLAANGRVNPRAFASDPELRKLVDVVGVGISDRESVHRPVLRGLHPAIPQDARIVLWGGGMWDWLDPLTLVRAWPEVIKHFPQARLVFLGTRHPNPLVPDHRVVESTIALAAETGEKDRTVFFFEWLPVEEREALLCEADIGIVLHPQHVETRYAIRTRVLDYVWARLPVLVSDGDVTSEWVRQYDLGRVAPPSNADAIAGALVEMLEMPKEAWAPAFEKARAYFFWSRVVEPLRQYCRGGALAADRKITRLGPEGARPGKIWRGRLARARYIWRNQGSGALLRRLWRFLQWRLSQ
jgi:GT2 family glycosyltransferase